jgi:hypothetical protein
VQTRIQTSKPEDLRNAANIYRHNEFNPYNDKENLAKGTGAITSEDISRLHKHHQDRFMEYVNEVAPEHAKSFAAGQSPHVFDIMEGKAGTPEQQQAGKAYAANMEQAKRNIAKNNAAMAAAKAERGTTLVERLSGAADRVDPILKGVYGSDFKDLSHLYGLTPKEQDRTWAGFGKDLSGTGLNAFNSPVGMLATTVALPGIGALGNAAKAGLGTSRWGLAGGYGVDAAGSIAKGMILPGQIGGTASALTGLAGGTDFQKDLARDVGYAAGRLKHFTIPSARMLGEGLKGTATGQGIDRLIGLGNLGVGGYSTLVGGNELLNAYKKIPSYGEIARGTKNEHPEAILQNAARANDTFSPEQRQGDNTLPDYKNLNEQLTGINPRSAAGSFNLGAAGSHPDMAGMDDRIANFSKLAPEQQTAERTAIDQTLATHFGSNMQEYSNYASTNKELGTNYLNFEQAQNNYRTLLAQTQGGSTGATAAFAKAEQDYIASRNALSDSQQKAAVNGTPFMTKALNKRYETEIKPIEADSQNVATQLNAVKDKIYNNQPLSQEDLAVIEKGKGYMSTVKNFSYDKARLEFMKSGKINPEMEQFLTDKSPEGIKALNQLFSGRNEPVIGKDGKPIMTVETDPTTGQKVQVPLMQNSNMLQQALDQQIDKQLASAPGAQPGQPGGQPVGPPTQEPSYFEQAKDFVHNQLLGNMQPWEKWLVYGGLSLAAVGMIGSMLGGGDEDDEEGGSWMPLLSLLGIGVGVGLPVAKHFGFDLGSLFGGGGATGGAPASKAAPPDQKTMQGIAAVRQTAQKDPKKAVGMVGDLAKGNPEFMKGIKKIDAAKNSILQRGFVNAKRVAAESGGALTEQDAQMLLDNWPAVRTAAGL